VAVLRSRHPLDADDDGGGCGRGVAGSNLADCHLGESCSRPPHRPSFLKALYQWM